MKLEKGSILYFGGLWFVVVKSNETTAGCICDNANNVYDHVISQSELTLTPYEACKYAGWGTTHDEKKDDALSKIDREIPSNIIAEVLSGCHDKRF